MDKCLTGKNSGWAYVNRGFYPVSAEREWVQVINIILCDYQHNTEIFIIVRKSSPSFTKSSSLVLIRPIIIIIIIIIITINKIQPFKISKMYKEIYGHPDNLSCNPCIPQ